MSPVDGSHRPAFDEVERSLDWELSPTRTRVCVFGRAWTMPGTAGLWSGELWVPSQHKTTAVLVQRASRMDAVCLSPGSCAQRFPCPLRKRGCCSFRAVLSIS